MNDDLHLSVFESMAAHLSQATVEMFADYEIPVSRSEFSPELRTTSETEQAGMAVLGYVGSSLRGALVLVAPKCSIEGWLARIGGEGGDPADALGEFANMLLGRLKTRLLPEGVPIQLATPTIAMGQKLKVSNPPKSSASLWFDDPEGRIHMRLDATFDPDFTIQEPQSDDVPAQAGEALLF